MLFVVVAVMVFVVLMLIFRCEHVDGCKVDCCMFLYYS